MRMTLPDKSGRSVTGSNDFEKKPICGVEMNKCNKKGEKVTSWCRIPDSDCLYTGGSVGMMTLMID